MKMKIALLIVIILGIILVPILMNTIGKLYFSRVKLYETNWDIDIPSDLKEIYHNQDRHGFQGDGRRYTIFVTNEVNFAPLINFNQKAKEIQISEGNSKEGKNKDVVEFVQAIITNLRISEINKPPFDEYYEWQKLIKHGNSTLIILYFPSAHRVYFIEELI